MTPNQKVICIDARPPDHPDIVDADQLIEGNTYVLSDVSMRSWGLGVRLVGFNHGYSKGEIWVRADRFIKHGNKKLTNKKYETRNQ